MVYDGTKVNEGQKVKEGRKGDIMRSITDQIEAHLKKMLQVSDKGFIEVQRSEIAQVFACVPSQINYVLTTRFSPEQGYLVESRRGGGGYLRIIKLELDDDQLFFELLASMEGSMIPQTAGEGLVERLIDEGFLTEREGLLMKSVISRDAIPVALPQRDLLRGSILKAMLLTLLRDEFK